MSKAGRDQQGSMLELWRPPPGAGDPLGCLASTYTFDVGFFDEQCLARYLEIESEPNREDLAFLLERETRLGGVYAGVLVDHSQAGVSHSLRWDVLPVRVPRGKQHAKISLLAWANHIRLIVASANLTEFGYRYNFEVAGHIDFQPGIVHGDSFRACCEFLRTLVGLVPGPPDEMAQSRRALSFIEIVEEQVGRWSKGRSNDRLRRHLVFTHPRIRKMEPSCALHSALKHCRALGNSPSEVSVASPFFDAAKDTDELDDTMTRLGKALARGEYHDVRLFVPLVGEPTEDPVRIAAPESLLRAARRYADEVEVHALPRLDDQNARPWHAKMVRLSNSNYNAVLIGSSNFTKAGMGIGGVANTEANLLYLAPREPRAREPGQLDELWPETTALVDPDRAQWLGPQQDLDEEEHASPAVVLPTGFLSVTYHAGESRALDLHFDIDHLPDTWSVEAHGHHARVLTDQAVHQQNGSPPTMAIPWDPPEPPEKILVRWDSGEAFWTVNVQDAHLLPPPEALARMSADEMLRILAASDPGTVFRAWVRRHHAGDPDDELDLAELPDLDPLKRYDLQETFLRRVRARARVLAAARANLERPVWSIQALDWRLRGLIGIQALAQRMLGDLVNANSKTSEAVLALADLLVMLDEVAYQEAEGAITLKQFLKTYRPFLAEQSAALNTCVQRDTHQLSRDVMVFWGEVVKRCQRH